MRLFPDACGDMRRMKAVGAGEFEREFGRSLPGILRMLFLSVAYRSCGCRGCGSPSHQRWGRIFGRGHLLGADALPLRPARQLVVAMLADLVQDEQVVVDNACERRLDLLWGVIQLAAEQAAVGQFAPLVVCQQHQPDQDELRVLVQVHDVRVFEKARR